METENSHQILQAGRNCTCIRKASRLSILVEGEAYYPTLRQALIKAERRIAIVAWEFHSQTELCHSDPADGYPTEIGPLLDALLEEKPELEVHVLVWDHSLIYLPEREMKLFSEWRKNAHPRLHFVEDETAPSGASHHQKIVTIDDRLVFAGGMDVSISRWDTSEHRPNEERRINPDGKHYPPYHDIHAAFEGDLATALCEVVYDRWEHATGEQISLNASESELWPDALEATFEDVDVSVSQILSSPEEKPSEIEQLHLDLIAAAKDFIYIENQYLASKTLTEALAARLQEEDGPDVIILLPAETSGWLVQSTVGVMRDRLLQVLHESDRHGRLLTCSPASFDEEGNKANIYVHAKLIVVDDRILKIGSSNLNNRSMGVDSEIDLCIERLDTCDKIKKLRQSLIANHLGLSEPRWAEIEENEASLAKAIRQGSDSESSRQLLPLEYGCDSELKEKLAESELLDPDSPPDPEFHISQSLPDDERHLVLKRITKVAVALTAIVLVGIGFYWAWGQLLSEERARAMLESIKDNSWLPLVVFLTFTIGGSLGISLNFMLVTTAVVLGTQYALLYGISGAMLSSCIGYYLGKTLGKSLLQKLNSKTVAALDEKLANRSFKSVAFVRLLPIAPFFIVNMAAGASQLKFKPYLIGTLLGMAPGMSAVVLLANRAEAFAHQPSLSTSLSLGAVAALLLAAFLYLRKLLAAKPHAS
ncbi:VTT domain-containing protein [Pelagicoccus sp. NFK12]|uniref:VTT domain-containing protein n=1 Tax=Pelagicoccus enzymogenes TaxID=2773457 RepID=A0A927FBB2_9BACT|nr:VTT domain-containing protein [Pelagicoccus enzymogenes]MBD5781264.1 VTT domain-containing protein [Pelagicoccus enzymogenes]